MKKSALVVVVSLVVAVVVVYLFSSYRKAAAPSSKVPAGDPGTATSGRAELGREFLGYPDEFPKELAFMPASFDSSSKTKDATGKAMYSVSYRAETSPEYVGTQYREQLEKAGWSVFVSSSAGTTIVKAEHEQHAATVSIRPVDSRVSAVQIIYYPTK